MPKGKLPVLRDGDRLVPDSEAIRAELEARSGSDFDAGLSKAERGVSRAIIRMADEHLYYALVHDRWLDEAAWPVIRECYFARVPEAMRATVADGARETVRANLHGQGIGRHTPDEIAARAIEDLEAIEALIGEGPWLFGARPTAADCSAAAEVLGLLHNPAPTRLRRYVEESAALRAYAERARSELLATPAAVAA
jgi:glutathione S-transferase